MVLVAIFCALALFLLLLYRRTTKTYEFWKKLDIPGPEPVFGFGNFCSVICAQKSIGDAMTEFYTRYKHEPVFGLYIRRQRVLGVCDPEVIKTVLIKDFSKFSSRGIALNEVAEPLSQHLFALEPRRWRPLRSRFSPIFTSGKLKDMFCQILDCSYTLEKWLDNLVASGGVVDVREISARFTVDVIGSCAFGVDMKAMSSEQSRFREIGKEFFGPGWKQILRIRIRETLPRSVYSLLGYLMPRDDTTEFFTKAITDVMRYRRENNIVKADFINALMELEAHPEKLDIELTQELLVAQAFVFFAAGFETSASTISCALYELAQNQELQDNLRKEIREYHELNNGQWQYEDMKKMPCLDKVFKETLRKYPPVTVLTRQAVEDYTFESLKITIPKNTKVFIPTYAIHRDPDIYPNPDAFDISRFTEEAVAARNPMHYLPFGDGPRNCIGARFAVFQTRIGLIQMLRNHKVDVCEQTQIPFINDPRTFVLQPKHSIVLRVSKLSS